MGRHRYGRPAALALFVAFCLLAAPAAAAPVAACILRPAGVAGGEIGELTLGGKVVMRIRVEAGGLSVAQRCYEVARRMTQALATWPTPDVRPAVINDQVVVQANDGVLVTVTPQAAALNGTSPAVLAWIWANQVRAALNLAALGWEAIPYAGLDGLKQWTASWYGQKFAGRRTSSGETFDPNAFTAAHRSLPFGSLVRVINPANGAQAVVRINDRGPWTPGRDLDLSRAAAAQVGLLKAGVGRVWVEVLRMGGAGAR